MVNIDKEDYYINCIKYPNIPCLGFNNTIIKEHLRGAGVLIYNPYKKSILVVRGKKKWSIPKGHFDSIIDKNITECAMRELLEETNIDLFISKSNPYIKYIDYIYYVIILSDENDVNIKSNDIEEINDVKWVNYFYLRNKYKELNSFLKKLTNNWNYILSLFDKLNIVI